MEKVRVKVRSRIDCLRLADLAAFCDYASPDVSNEQLLWYLPDGLFDHWFDVEEFTTCFVSFSFDGLKWSVPYLFLDSGSNYETI